MTYMVVSIVMGGIHKMVGLFHGISHYDLEVALFQETITLAHHFTKFSQSNIEFFGLFHSNLLQPEAWG